MKFTQTEELEKVQANVKKMVERGEISKIDGVRIVLNKTVELLESLKVPESQTWEEKEYGYMARTNN